ncbi:hypothetical protein CVS30_03810 [Arthrobacter psychrolactophilus]|uniref:Uncharacterized protein n=1 Tax=Arthrobacter psychrolactophilus TaxID=92442 RepID=A0A2V5ITF9_9MICC|nr:hypothetical protein CVS30_03810 [Arthrobacter psychrolactophilus]
MSLKRPYLTPRKYIWRDADGKETPGVALTRGDEIKAHLTPTEARTMADKLHDYADKAEIGTTP